MPPVQNDPLLLLLAALALDAVVGDPPWLYRRLPHPVALLGALIGFLDRRLNRDTRGAQVRRWRGLIVVIVVTALAAGAGWLIHAVTLATRWGWLLEVGAAAVLVAQRSLYQHVRDVARGLTLGGIAGGRAAVARIVGRDPESLDEHGICRAAIESLAENFSDGVVAPVFWFALLGLPGMAAAKAINTLDSMIGHLNDRYRAFGEAAARLDTAMNYVPARLSGLLLAAAAAIAPGGNPAAALRTMRRDATSHRSFNAGWPEAAAAGALNSALAGPRRYGGAVVNDPWIGNGRARATTADIARALYLYAVACAILAGIVGALALLSL